MDWPVIGAVTAVAIVGGAVTYEAVTLLRSDLASAKTPHVLASYGTSVERTAYDIPGFGNGSAERTLSFPLIRLIDPDRAPDPASATPVLPPSSKAPDGNAQRRPPVLQETAKAALPLSSQPKLAKLTPTETSTPAPSQALAPARAEQWRVVATANANFRNLGGHIDAAGIVDGMATPYLRDALRQHSRFAQLPPDIKTQILTQNIDLPRLAPYRGLIGMDDRILDQEQGVKFIRIR
ncbi:hypothetical protein [Bradyrhizobium sp. WSM1417]|uniref:hypothetical protein n=1 Tax=Bradyrhizobium sp. WSM1417 TaxID=754500 RepID=UPI000489BEDE|nr:hypothetical protein [Bradyrhizobium sp. WSM1417]